MATAISSFRKPVRVILGDRDPAVRLYSDGAIDDAVEVIVRMGKLTGFTTDGSDIAPDVSDPNDYALLTYEVVKAFVDSHPDRYSYKTRAIGESFGSWRDFIRSLEENIHALRGGTMFSGWQSFHSWLSSIAGLPLAHVLTEVEVEAPLNSFTVGSGGVN